MRNVSAVIVTVIIGTVVLTAWWWDHSYHLRVRQELSKEAELIVLVRQVEDAVSAVRAAQDRYQYEHSCQRGCEALRKLAARGPFARIAVFAYAESIRTPSRFHSDCSLAAEAEVGLAAIGPDAIPIIISLLRDDDGTVQESGMEVLVMMTSRDKLNTTIDPLPPDIGKRVLEEVREGLGEVAMARVREEIEHVLKQRQ